MPISHSVRIGHCIMWSAAAIGALASLLIVASVVLPGRLSALSVHRCGIHVARGTVEIVWGSHDVTWVADRWTMSASGNRAAVVNWSESSWRPNTNTARMLLGAGGTGGTLVTLHATYVPLWPWAVVLAGIFALLWWRLPRRIAEGTCGNCGYDVRGLSGSVCPECGGTIARLLAKIMRGVPNLLVE